MPKQVKYGLDGFTVRRRTSAGISVEDKSGRAKPAVPKQFLKPSTAGGLQRSVEPIAHDRLPRPQPDYAGNAPHRLTAAARQSVSRSEIDQSLQAVDAEPKKGKKHGKRGDKKGIFRRGRGKKRWIALAIGVILLGTLGYFVFKFILTSQNIFSGNIFDLLGSGAQLKKDENGRTNILVFGTSEDDEGHAGAELTDSIMVISLHQENNTAGMISVPRDLWVDYGKACSSGYAGKINVVYACAAEDSGEAAGAQALQKKVGEIFGLDVQYYTKVNYTVVRELTSALGGVTVNIESDDPRGIYDVYTKLRYPNGPATLQGEEALAFVRARGGGGGYGFEGSNFAREKNQQQMIVGIRNKALNVGTLSNPVAMNGIMDALGNNIRTNFSAGEIKTLAGIAQKIPAESIKSISLVDEENPVVTTGSYSGQSIVRPIAGLTDYSKIRAYIAKKLRGDSGFEDEKPVVLVLNASNVDGAAGKKQTELESAGFDNVTADNATEKITSSVAWYDLTNGSKTKSRAKLAELLGKQPTGTTLPNSVQSDADFVILIGDGSY